MKPRFLIFLLVSCCLTFPAFAAEGEPVLTDAVARDIGQTYGFYLGQSFSLDAIEQKFPAIAPQARIAKLQFDASFGSSITNMDAVLARRGGEWSKVKSELRDKIATTLGTQTLTPDSAKEFAEAVTKRAKGDIPSPVIETLLTFHPSYISKPGSEFVDGFRTRFASDGSGKAKGVRFHLDYPKSWSSADGNRPNIVRKFVSQNGRGFEMIMVMVESAVGLHFLVTGRFIHSLLPDLDDSDSVSGEQRSKRGAGFEAALRQIRAVVQARCQQFCD